MSAGVRFLCAMKWYLYRSGSGAPAFNMAMDEALLEAMPRLDVPVMRFYAWAEPAATFGYFQEYSQVEHATHLRPLIRRPTGGGVVPHESDWTYSIVCPAGHTWYRLKAPQTYHYVHQWIQAAFALLSMPTELASEACTTSPGQCFAGWVQSDVLCNGRKIAGAAQRRTRTGLLIQGSIQPGSNWPARANWEHAMIKIGTDKFGICWVEFEPDAILLECARDLVARKYGRPAYNQKR